MQVFHKNLKPQPDYITKTNSNFPFSNIHASPRYGMCSMRKSPESEENIPVFIKASTSFILSFSPIIPAHLLDTSIHVCVRIYHPSERSPWSSQICIWSSSSASDDTSASALQNFIGKKCSHLVLISINTLWIWCYFLPLGRYCSPLQLLWDKCSRSFKTCDSVIKS